MDFYLLILLKIENTKVYLSIFITNSLLYNLFAYKLKF